MINGGAKTFSVKLIKKDKNDENVPKGSKDIPGPMHLPLFGTKWIYLWKYDLSKMHEAYEDMHQKFGPIILDSRAPPVPVVSLTGTHPRDLLRVLRYPSRFPTRPPTEIVAKYRRSRPDRYASSGIVNEQGPSWHKLRTSLTPELTSPRTISGFLPTLNDICRDFVSLLRLVRNPDTGVVEGFETYADRLGLEASCALMLGRRMGFLETKLSLQAELLSKSVRDAFVAQRDSYFGARGGKVGFLRKCLFGTGEANQRDAYQRLQRSEEIIYNIVSQMVDEALELRSKPNDSYKPRATNAVFESILANQDLDLRDKKSAIIDFISAGIETLANTLTFVLYNLSRHKTCQIKVLEEINNIKNDTFDSSEELSSKDLSSMSYTKACITETYRLTPTAFCLARVLETDMNICGYTLPTGTVVLCQTMLACRDEKNFINAKKFVPERWLTERRKLARSLVVPFGVGRRMCPGKRFVDQELLTVVATLVSSFEIEFEEDLDMKFEFLLGPQAPVNITLRDRQE
ncbi:ecdysone 20-monooxygenase-like [Ctenocephalides felis]|uniref:ecdysone 20-monooxygenase-like n=1 Tax=Ctenocephalides felis TaxID=7515 RepID=UPI000E6E35A2|nr:ecdysone 20-monooxygenase-like [Ctenocephalides felis]